MKHEFKRLNLEEVQDMETSCESEITKEKALEVFRFLLSASIEHLLGFKMPREKLKSKIFNRFECGEIKVKDMTDNEAIEYLTDNFYRVEMPIQIC